MWLDVTRWRSDTTLDAWGSFVYIRDLRSDAVWSAAYHPVGGRLGTSSASFSADRAEFHRTVLGIESTMDVTVTAEDEVENAPIKLDTFIVAEPGKTINTNCR